MLKTLSPLLTGDLLKILADMGHGDELVIADANFPGHEMGRRVVDMPGANATEVMTAVTSLLPLDEFVDAPVAVMDAAGQRAPIYDEFIAIAEAAEGRSIEIDIVERFDFYGRARAAYAVVLTGERRLYGNVILKKGVIHP